MKNHNIIYHFHHILEDLNFTVLSIDISIILNHTLLCIPSFHPIYGDRLPPLADLSIP